MGERLIYQISVKSFIFFTHRCTITLMSWDFRHIKLLRFSKLWGLKDTEVPQIEDLDA